MRFFLGIPRRWPWVGLAFAVGLLVGDAVFVVRPTFGWFEDESLWPLAPMGAAFAAYLAFGVAGDWLAQGLWPATRRSFVLRVLVLSGMSAALTLAADEARSVLLAAAGAAFALLCLGRFTWPLAAVGATLALWPAFTPPSALPPPTLAAPPAAGAPSFVVVVLDTVRLDRTSAYGHSRDTTPNLRSLAERGVRFERAYATGSWSLPTHASLFTGLGTERHGAHNEHLSLSEEHPTLAGVLAERGWETVSTSGNPWLGRGTGMARGFQRVHEPWRQVHMKWFLLAWRLWAGLAAPDRDKGGADTLDALRRWRSERDPSRPYLLFVNLMEAHGPYQAVPRSERNRFTAPGLSLRDLERVGMRGWEASQDGKPLADELRPDVLDLYDGAIHAADAYLGQILALIQDDDPVVAVLADHGEYAGEKTLYGHPSLLYEGSLHIPLVMAGGALPEGKTVDALVSTADLMPTLLAIARVEAPAGLDGIDLRPVIAGVATAGRTIRAEAYHPPDSDDYWPKNRPELAAELIARKRAVLRGSVKRIVGEDGTDVTYDLATDPAEKDPLPSGAVSLAAGVPGPPAAGEAAPLDPAQRRALEALGYLERE